MLLLSSIDAHSHIHTHAHIRHRAELAVLREQQAASASEFETELGAAREKAANLEQELAAASGLEAEVLEAREKAANLEKELAASLQQAGDEAEEQGRKIKALEEKVGYFVCCCCLLFFVFICYFLFLVSCFCFLSERCFPLVSFIDHAFRYLILAFSPDYGSVRRYSAALMRLACAGQEGHGGWSRVTCLSSPGRT